MENETDPLAQFGLGAIDLRWTLKDIAANRAWIINKQHLAQLIDLGLVEMREGALPHRCRAKCSLEGLIRRPEPARTMPA
jgi:hypothetical protein